MIVYPRKRFDFKYIDLLIALGYCLNPLLDRNQIGYSIKKLWPNGNVLIGLSVRTIFDALLSELNFHRGSEVIMTGGVQRWFRLILICQPFKLNQV